MFKVTRGQKYLFRVIGTGALYPWRISVDQHNLTMVAVDSFTLHFCFQDKKDMGNLQQCIY
jgi:FtsP/CotA-like multicopper oxidase with cupredoxin domain